MEGGGGEGGAVGSVNELKTTSSSTPTTSEQSPLPIPRIGPAGDAPKDPGVASGCHQSYTEKDYEGRTYSFTFFKM